MRDFDGAWVTDLSGRDGESSSLYVGDARGVLSVYATPSHDSLSQQAASAQLADVGTGSLLHSQRSQLATTEGDVFHLTRAQQKIHALGISRVVLVPHINLLLTIGHDQALKVSNQPDARAPVCVNSILVFGLHPQSAYACIYGWLIHVGKVW